MGEYRYGTIMRETSMMTGLIFEVAPRIKQNEGIKSGSCTLLQVPMSQRSAGMTCGFPASQKVLVTHNRILCGYQPSLYWR